MLSIVKFYADWCGPCNSMKAMLDEINEENKWVTFSNVNIDHNPQLVKEHHVRSIPTFIAYKNGIEISRNYGAVTKSTFQDWLNELRNLKPELVGNNQGGQTVVLKEDETEEDA